MARNRFAVNESQGVAFGPKTYHPSKNAELEIIRLKFPGQKTPLTAVQFKEYIDKHVIGLLVELANAGEKLAQKAHARELVARIEARKSAAKEDDAELKELVLSGVEMPDVNAAPEGEAETQDEAQENPENAN